MTKQGRADISGPADRKVEPSTKDVNPGGVSNLGRAHGNHATDTGTFKPQITPMYNGRGYEAPPIRNTSNKSGSQGRY